MPTHEILFNALNSEAIAGNDVATIVWSNAAKKIANDNLYK